MKKITLISLAAIICVMMAATIVEKFKGTPFAGEYIYGSWWFVLLWLVLSVASIAYVIKMRLYKRLAVIMLHTSFVIILIGALTTFLTAQRGDVHLREGMKVSMFSDADKMSHQLPFTLEVKRFDISYYPGTDAPLDYVSDVLASDNKGSETLHISMNNIGTFRGYRFYQFSYDSDMHGTTLGVAYDPYGIGITYFGYLLLLVSIFFVLLSKQTRIRQLYRIASQRVVVLLFAFVFASVSLSAKENHHVLPKERADKFGELLVLYNNRICPINTLAIDFVTKLSGKAVWDGLSANEVFSGWVFYSSNWEHEKFIRIKDKDAQRALGIEGQWASFDDFWDGYNEYKLEKPLQTAYNSGDKAAIKHLQDADEKFNLIRMFYNGEFLHIYPYPIKKGQLEWFFPGDTSLPKQMKSDEWNFVRRSLDYLSESVMTHDQATTDLLLDKIGKYQRKRGGEVVPTETKVNAELVYNDMQTQRWPVFFALVMGVVVFVLCFMRPNRWTSIISNVWNVSLFLWLTTLLALRWYISGHMPLSNGYETMQFMAWTIVVLTLALQRPFGIIRAFGPLLAGFALLVSMLSGQNPQITQLMPVLQSPLLSIHVVVIMFSYALLAMTFLVSLTAIVKTAYNKDVKQDTALSQLLLYPAVMCLTIGIFIGAVWANVSWGRYWSWDSKETWALITMLVYALPLHTTLFPQKKAVMIGGKAYSIYNIYILFAFLSVLMTYFGVNYLLAGLHSYANV